MPESPTRNEWFFGKLLNFGINVEISQAVDETNLPTQFYIDMTTETN